MTILVDIVTPERRLLAEEVDMVTLPGTLGQMGILGGHTPLLSTLAIGEIVLHKKGVEPRYIAVGGGIAEVRPTKVTILAESAEQADEIDIERAEAARERARSMVEQAGTPQRDPAAAAALRRSTLRLKVARRRRTHQTSGPHFEGES